MSFTDMWDSLWSTPSVDASGILNQQSPDEIAAAAKVLSSTYPGMLRAALEDLGFTTVLTNHGVDATRIAGLSAADRQAVQNNITNQGGILTLQDILDQKTIGIYSDSSDTDEYNSRYSSLDIKAYHEDGSDIAFLRIIKAVSRAQVFPDIRMTSLGGISKNKFKQFIVTQTSLQHQERMQIVETNKEYQVLFFGIKAEILQVGGILKNTIDNPWSMNMVFLWDELMRGTELVKKGNVCQLYIDGELFEGYPFNFTRSKAAGSDNLVSFGFQFLIRERFAINMHPTVQGINFDATSLPIPPRTTPEVIDSLTPQTAW